MILSKPVYQYIERLTSAPDLHLAAIERQTYLTTLAPQMISGKVQGAFLAMVSQMISPQRVLEIGTFTGYGAICLASGLTDDGVVHTIEADHELQATITNNIQGAKCRDKIVCHFDRAQNVIPQLKEFFDLVFIDAGKRDYLEYYDLVFDKVRPGGFILADNALWDGKVLEEEPDLDTRTIMKFNEHVQADGRVENVLLPLVDGMMICRKK